MRPLKFEWREGPHGVDSLKIIGEKGIFIFVANPPSGPDTTEHPFDRAAALKIVKSLSEEILERLATGHDLHRS
jgi:hypothetical protein